MARGLYQLIWILTLSLFALLTMGPAPVGIGKVEMDST